MSVEEKLVRLTPPAFESLLANPATLIHLIEDLNSADYFDVPVPRIIHLDEFTIWLLTDRNEPTALCDAVVAWRDNQELIGAQHGQGFAYATYQSPEEVNAIASGLEMYPKEELSKRFFSKAESFRQAAAQYIAGDQAILAYQLDFFKFLHRFYHEAAQKQEFVLHFIV